MATNEPTTGEILIDVRFEDFEMRMNRRFDRLDVRFDAMDRRISTLETR